MRNDEETSTLLDLIIHPRDLDIEASTAASRAREHGVVIVGHIADKHFMIHRMMEIIEAQREKGDVIIVLDSMTSMEEQRMLERMQRTAETMVLRAPEPVDVPATPLKFMDRVDSRKHEPRRWKNKLGRKRR
jgi:hypothetical protein